MSANDLNIYNKNVLFLLNYCSHHIFKNMCILLLNIILHILKKLNIENVILYFVIDIKYILYLISCITYNF